MNNEDPARPALQLKSQKFRDARERDWRTLSRALDCLDQGKLNSFSTDELLNLPVLYRSAVSSLSMARSISLDRNLIGYLQGLCARAYMGIYGPHARFKDILTGYFGRQWPESVRRIGSEFWLSLACLVIGIVAGWLLCAGDQSWYSALVGEDMAGGRNLSASAADLKETLQGRTDGLAFFSVFLMSHNTQVSIFAFALGVIAGIPTALLILHNGMLLGAMLWLFARQGLLVDFAGWLSIHGTTELLAIVLAGAAGFHMARRIMFPGNLTRKAALVDAGKLTGSVMLGVAIMLLLAGLLEGFGRQLITGTSARFGVGAVMLVVWVVYFTQAGKRLTLRFEEADHGRR
ncbi:stage II sporulation protein M [Asticcacaulis sp. SL142]|uniref:stage II sporulation protein M n=1 Tax=Asticcacaulis sp. SL142 TaxID=2995155 RepID=UPI00226C87AD|nr:stage II sporulation protein M [Asticcacaulis sp. SL142]WAC47258.1 stage II sporulation protein M [Asticcacaulis sp. SL142]